MCGSSLKAHPCKCGEAVVVLSPGKWLAWVKSLKLSALSLCDALDMLLWSVTCCCESVKLWIYQSDCFTLLYIHTYLHYNTLLPTYLAGVVTQSAWVWYLHPMLWVSDAFYKMPMFNTSHVASPLAFGTRHKVLNNRMLSTHRRPCFHSCLGSSESRMLSWAPTDQKGLHSQLSIIQTPCASWSIPESITLSCWVMCVIYSGIVGELK